MEKLEAASILRMDRQTIKKYHHYRVTTEYGETIGYCKLRFNPLKEASVFTADEAGQQPVLIFRPHGKLYFRATIDIIDAATSNSIGSLRRKKIKSPPQWSLMNPAGDEHALFQDSFRGLGGALFYNLGSASSRWDYVIKGKKMGEYVTEGKPVKEVVRNYLKWKPDRSRKIKLDFSEDVSKQLDRQLALGAAILVGTMEISPPKPA